jgi:phage-related protein
MSLPRPFCLVTFGKGYQVYAWAGLDNDPPVYASQVARMTRACHHAQIFIAWDGVLGTAWTALKPQSSQSLPPKWLGLQALATTPSYHSSCCSD